MEPIFWSLKENVSKCLTKANEDWLKACNEPDAKVRVKLLESVQAELSGIEDDLEDMVADADEAVKEDAE